MISRRNFIRRAGISVSAVGLASAACALPAIAEVAPPEPDAELIRLGVRLQAAWDSYMRSEAELRGDNSDAADCRLTEEYSACSEIVGQIEEISARSLLGVCVKALACSWCVSGEPFTDESFAVVGDASTDLRLAAGIIRDLLAIKTGGFVPASAPF